MVKTATEGVAARRVSPWTYFLDESGNSGDLARPGSNFTFDNQEIFVLAAVGVVDGGALAQVVADLKREHRVQAPELSFGSVRKKPQFIGDLLDALERLDAALISEVVDKRYFIGAHMINHLILPGSASKMSSQEAWVRYHLANYLSTAPTEVFRAFVTACQTPSAATISASFRSVIDWLGPRHAGDVPFALRDGARRGLAEFLKEGPDDPKVQAQWLPLPDPSHNDAPLWILPNLSSFTNAYARINKFHGRDLKGVLLVHDEQRYYAHVLTHNKALVENLAALSPGSDFRHADWGFESKAALVFADSKAAPGVQVADVLAGFLMDYVRDKLHRGNGRSKEWRELFLRLNDLGDARRGLGINFVVPDRAMAKLGLIPQPDPYFANAGSRR